MRVSVICDKWEHHAAHSGYDQLCRYVQADRLRKGVVYGILRRFPRRLNRKFPDIWENWRVPYHSARELETFVRSLFRRRDIYHFLYGENTVRLLPYIKRRSSKIVCTFHQPEEILKKGGQFHRTISKLDGIVVLARNQVPYYAKFAGPEKVFFVPHGIDTRRFTPGRGRRDARRLLFVGNWLRDFDTLASIMRELAAVRPEIVMDTVTLKKNFQFFDGLSNVRCHAGINEEALIGMYGEAALLVLPLINATANNALLEAIACGLPIVTNDVGGVRDYVNDKCACILPASSAPAFTEKILALLNNEKKRAEMSAAARERAMQYDWSEIARQMQAVYDTVLKNRDTH